MTTSNFLLDGDAFTPDELRDIVTAFEGVCNELGVSNGKGPEIETVASTLVEVAKAGAIGAAQIQQRALHILQHKAKAHA
jgi:hypothetical protein